MYDNIGFYQTPSGNIPFEKYLGKLAKKHKDDDVVEVLNYIEKLSEFGFEINDKFKPKAIKHLQDGVYELRPTSSRIFFFCYINGMFIILHGWEKNKTKQILKKLIEQFRRKIFF